MSNSPIGAQLFAEALEVDPTLEHAREVLQELVWRRRAEAAEPGATKGE